MSSLRRPVEPGGLWPRLQAVSASALESGALVSLSTDRERLPEGEFDFQVRVASNLRRKDAQRRQALDSAFDPTSREARPNPFLPYDPALYVGDLSHSHVGLLNKFNVLDHHLLVVTRDFAPQRSLLDLSDLEALWWCLREIDGLGFYNGGEEAGASQPHKHLQLVPLPLAWKSHQLPSARGRPPESRVLRDRTTPGEISRLDDAGPRFPLEPAWDRAPACGPVVSSPALGFPHGLVRLGPGALGPGALGPGADLEQVARELHQRYLELLAHVGLAVHAGQRHQPGPYNLLVTRRWMLLVPRVAEHFGGISLNGLAFAGSLFVRDRSQLEVLRAAGPWRALREVTGGGSGGPP